MNFETVVLSYKLILRHFSSLQLYDNGLLLKDYVDYTFKPLGKLKRSVMYNNNNHIILEIYVVKIRSGLIKLNLGVS